MKMLLTISKVKLRSSHSLIFQKKLLWQLSQNEEEACAGASFEKTLRPTAWSFVKKETSVQAFSFVLEIFSEYPFCRTNQGHFSMLDIKLWKELFIFDFCAKKEV